MHTLKVVVDPGHGGAAPLGHSSPLGVQGASGTLEKEITLAVAKRMAARAPAGLSLWLTRDRDHNLSLASRARQGPQRGADVFLSLHANGAGAPGQRGSEVWIHSRASAASRRLAEAARDALALSGAPAVVRQGPMAVLDPDFVGARPAAALVELDYLSSPAGEARLRDPRALDLMADGLLSAVLRYGEEWAGGLDAGAGGLQVTNPPEHDQRMNRQGGAFYVNTTYTATGTAFIQQDTVCFEFENTAPGHDMTATVTLSDDQSNGPLPGGRAQVVVRTPPGADTMAKACIQFSGFPLRADQVSVMGSCLYEIALVNNPGSTAEHVWASVYSY